MALNKQNLTLNFSQGLDTKTDSKQVTPGKMLALSNSVFQKGGLLQKRNGFEPLTSLPVTDATTLTTFGGSLVAVGKELYNYAPETEAWYTKGMITPVTTSTTPLVRSSTAQVRQDVAVTPEGLSCAVWADSDGTSKYQINDTQSSQIIVAATNLPSTTTDARVFLLGRYFVITFMQTVGSTHLRYIAIPLSMPNSPGTPTDIGLTASSLTAGYDGYANSNGLYIAWSDSAPAIKIVRITPFLAITSPVTIATANVSPYVSVTIDPSNSVVWVSFFDGTTFNLYTTAWDINLGVVLGQTFVANDTGISRITSSASNRVLTLFYQRTNTYTYAPNHETDYLVSLTCSQTGSVHSNGVVLRSIGLASKSFTLNSTTYVMVAYGTAAGDSPPGGVFQPTYFLCDSLGNIVAKLAYSNGGGYGTDQVLPSAWMVGNEVQIGYLYKDLLTSVNKTQGVANVNGIYSQTGINLVTWTLNEATMPTAEIGNDLHLGGGFLWMYDGTRPVEHGFHVWPEDIAITTATGSGGLIAQQYYYQWVYEWTDAQGNIHRSAPSIPVGQLTTTASSTNTIHVPTLRLTYKTAGSKVRIVGYRWSTAQQNYYQITSITTPVTNDTTIDSITYVDTASDASILGNQLIYTTGGVVENIAAPGADAITLYKSRLVLIDSEDKNLLWFSKQVIENTPVEMSDLFTQYIAPTAGAQGSTGINTALSAMDDKLIIFKRDAIYYLVGTGPDNTGANNDFSEPNYITSTAGCTNPQSIVFMPQGLMFQSDKGIWLLGRDLSTTYIGAPVEAFTVNSTVVAALNIPGTNQVRFTLDSGTTLMYDYYYGQWGTFTGIPGIASTLFENLHTYINSSGATFQESPGTYLDNTTPVLMSFTTAWMSMAGMQGFERAYFFYLLGEYITPHKLSIGIAYDFDPSISQTAVITPDNYSPPYGLEPGPYGSNIYGGISSVEQWRVFLERQKCQSFQLTITESFDPQYGTVAGAGLTLSGINLVIGLKKPYTTIRSGRSVG